MKICKLNVYNEIHVKKILQKNAVFDRYGKYRSSPLRCSIEKLFLKIPQYSQKNACVGVHFG